MPRHRAEAPTACHSICQLASPYIIIANAILDTDLKVLQSPAYMPCGSMTTKYLCLQVICD